MNTLCPPISILNAASNPMSTEAPRASTTGSRWDPDRLASLEEERAHLLSSLLDLESEYAAGDLDEADYLELRDGYTARTAQVLREIEAGRAEIPERGRGRWLQTAMWSLLVIVVAVVAGIVVAQSSGQRLPGLELTGGLPGDVTTTLAEARMMLGVDPARAQALYTDVLAERPNHPEALTYSGWLLAINSLGAEPELRSLALDTAERTLERAIAVDPNYADPHCFLAVIAANFTDQPDRATELVTECLDRNPPAEMRGLITQLVPSG